MADSPTKRASLFISYSHKDKEYLERLQKFLNPHVRSGGIPLWDDTQIKPGDDWYDEIRQGLARARVAILLVSIDFLDSKFIMGEELPALLKAAKEDGALILPVVVTPCNFSFTNLSRFQAVNTPSKPLSGMSQHEQDQIWERVVESVLKALDTQQNPPVLPTLPEPAHLWLPARPSGPPVQPKPADQDSWGRADQDEWGQPDDQWGQPAGRSTDDWGQPDDSWGGRADLPWERPAIRSTDDWGQPDNQWGERTDFPWEQPAWRQPPSEASAGEVKKTVVIRKDAGKVGTPSVVVVRQGKDKKLGRTYNIRKDHVKIGRSRDSDIFLEDLAVSRIHATIYRDEMGTYLLRDENSANGTSVNGQRISEVPLWEGDEIQVGETILAFIQSDNIPSWKEESPVEKAAILDVQPAVATASLDKRPGAAVPALIVRQGKEPGRTYHMHKDHLTIGRSRESDIFLEDLAVSRLHATIYRDGMGGYLLRDEHSAHGTSVNGWSVISEVLLEEGNEIQVGQTILAFIFPDVDEDDMRIHESVKRWWQRWGEQG